MQKAIFLIFRCRVCDPLAIHRPSFIQGDGVLGRDPTPKLLVHGFVQWERSILPSLVHGSVQMERHISKLWCMVRSRWRGNSPRPCPWCGPGGEGRLLALVHEFPKREGSLSMVVIQPKSWLPGDAMGQAIDAPCQVVRNHRAQLVINVIYIYFYFTTEFTKEKLTF